MACDLLCDCSREVFGVLLVDLGILKAAIVRHCVHLLWTKLQLSGFLIFYCLLKICLGFEGIPFLYTVRYWFLTIWPSAAKAKLTICIFSVGLHWFWQCLCYLITTMLEKLYNYSMLSLWYGMPVFTLHLCNCFLHFWGWWLLVSIMACSCSMRASVLTRLSLEILVVLATIIVELPGKTTHFWKALWHHS